MLINIIKSKYKGVGIIEIIILIVVVGIIAAYLINAMTTTAVVMDELGKQDDIKNIARSYLSTVAEKAQKFDFYTHMRKSDLPPVPLTSEYTDSGRYTIEVDKEDVDRDSVKVTMTFRKSSETSFSEPVFVASTVIHSPERKADSY